MNGAAILFTPAVGFAIFRVLALLLLPVLPLAAVAAVFRPGRGVVAGLRAALLAIAAVACGVLFAPGLLDASALAGMLRFGAIFPAADATDAPWQIGFHAFLTERALPLLTAPVALVRQIAEGTANPDIARSSLLLAAVALLLVIGPLFRRHTRLREKLRDGARNLLLVFWGAYATVYTIALVLWLASLLNFWCFLVLFVLTLLLRD